MSQNRQIKCYWYIRVDLNFVRRTEGDIHLSRKRLEVREIKRVSESAVACLLGRRSFIERQDSQHTVVEGGGWRRESCGRVCCVPALILDR